MTYGTVKPRPGEWWRSSVLFIHYELWFGNFGFCSVELAE